MSPRERRIEAERYAWDWYIVDTDDLLPLVRHSREMARRVIAERIRRETWRYVCDMREMLVPPGQRQAADE